jgi:hypothetical protein
MRVTIIRDDNSVGINGQFVKFDLSALPETLRVVQWDGSAGWEEWRDGPNQALVSMAAYQGIINIASDMISNPYYDMTPEQVKSVMWDKIKASRDMRKSGGFKVGQKWFHSDTESRIQQIGLVMAGAAVPAVPWKTMDGSFETMTPTLAGQIFQSAFALDAALFGKAEEHRALMELSADPGSYDFSTGWPENFYGL